MEKMDGQQKMFAINTAIVSIAVVLLVAITRVWVTDTYNINETSKVQKTETCAHIDDAMLMQICLGNE